MLVYRSDLITPSRSAKTFSRAKPLSVAAVNCNLHRFYPVASLARPSSVSTKRRRADNSDGEMIFFYSTAIGLNLRRVAMVAHP